MVAAASGCTAGQLTGMPHVEHYGAFFAEFVSAWFYHDGRPRSADFPNPFSARDC
jgi:hypothetical protein